MRIVLNTLRKYAKNTLTEKIQGISYCWCTDFSLPLHCNNEHKHEQNHSARKGTEDSTRLCRI